MARDYLRRSYAGGLRHGIDETVKNDICHRRAPADHRHHLDGILTVKGQGHLGKGGARHAFERKTVGQLMEKCAS